MPRRRNSLEERLPDDVLAHVNRMLAERFKLDDVMAWLNDGRQPDEPISRSALGRHSLKIENVAVDLKQTRIMAEALGREMADSSDDTQIGRVAIEMLQSISMKSLAASISGNEPDLSPQEISWMSKSLKDMMSAITIDDTRRAKIKAEARKEALEQAAAVVGEAVKSGGLTEETAVEIQDRVMGLSG